MVLGDIRLHKPAPTVGLQNDESVGVGLCNLMSILLFDLKQNLPSPASGGFILGEPQNKTAASGGG